MADKHIPMRMCVACRKMRESDKLIRFVREVNTGTVMTDTDKKLFGRGAYICKSGECVKSAIKKKGLERHFKCAVPPEVYEAASAVAEGEN